jgi:hypothetical protein
MYAPVPTMICWNETVCNLLLQVWNWIMEPLLFATIGTSIVFSTLPSETIPKSLLVVCTGQCRVFSWAAVYLSRLLDVVCFTLP